MIPFEVLKSIEMRGLMKLPLYSAQPIQMLVADALIRLTFYRSVHWKEAMELQKNEAVGIEVSLEELSMMLERVDFHSGKLEDIQAINFWPHLLAAMEFCLGSA